MVGKNEELVVIMPAYNEEHALPATVAKWVSAIERLNIGYAFHLYDDGSRDRSHEVLERLSKHYPKLIVHSKQNTGHGPTILQGYRENSNFSYILQVDSDDEIQPDYFERFWINRASFDLQIGRRIFEKRSPIRVIISSISRMIIRAFYGTGVGDVNCPFRLMRTDVFRGLFFSLPSDTFAPNIIIAGYACKKKMSIRQHDVHASLRSTGTVSLRHFKLLRAAMQSMLQTVRFRFKQGDW